jgi:glutathione synthase
MEISVAYFRAGYGPKDYPTDSEWSARLLVEKSLAIKCPSIAYQLAGTKKIQQIVADQAVLRDLVPDITKATKLFESFTELLPLGGDDQHILDRILKSETGSEDFVMKPQREGGGNLLSKSAMIQALRSFDCTQRLDYILMRRIKPVEIPSIVLRAGQVQIIPNSIAELGIFTIFLKDTHGNEVVRNDYGGFLLRTKSASTEDGGISSRAYLDSPALI